jgi:hypothetical protein
VRTVVFSGLANINQGKGRVALQQGVKGLGGNFLGHINNLRFSRWGDFSHRAAEGAEIRRDSL